MSFIKSKSFLVAISAVVVLYFFIDVFFNLPVGTKIIGEYLKNIGVMVPGFAMILGGINIFMLHGRKIQRKEKDWYYSAYMVILFLIVLALGLFTGISSPQFTLILQKVFQPVAAAIYSMMAFYYIAAIYKVFRTRNTDSMILLISCITILLNNTPMLVSFFPQIIDIAKWVQDVPTNAALWATNITVGVGMVALGIRIIFMLEKKFVGSMEE